MKHLCGDYMKWPLPDPLGEAYMLLSYRSGQWGRVPGGFVETLEREFAKLHEVKYAVSVSSGTVGLMLSYLALNLPQGSRFIVPAYTFITTATAGVVVGLIPEFADIDPETLNIDVNHLAEILEEDKDNTIKLVVPVHFAGLPAEMDEILKLAREHGAYVVEDAAQAHCSAYKGRKVGGLGDLGVFSFQTSKMVSAGEGGIVVTNSYEFYERVWSYHNAGRAIGKPWYYHARIGLVLRMTEYQAAIVVSQLRRLDTLIKKVRRNAKVVFDELENVEHVHVHKPPSYVEPNFYFIPVSLDEEVLRRGGKEKLASLMAEKGFSLIEGYPMPIYRQEAFREERWKLPYERYAKLYLRGAEEACRRTMWIPHYELIYDENYTLRYVKALRETVREITS